MAVEHDRRLSSGVTSILQPMLKEAYVPPRPASRVGTSTDAAKYLRRNRCSSSLWLVKRCASIDLEDADNDDELGGSPTVRGCVAARGPRLTGDEASGNYRRSQGSVGIVMDEKNQVGYSSPRPQPRLTSSEAKANSCHKAGLFEQPSQSDRRPPVQHRRRIMSAEAEENAAKSAGTANSVLKTVDRPRTSELNAFRNKSGVSLCIDGISTGRKNDDTPRQRQRVKPEAEENARKSAGMTCAAAVAGRLPGDAVLDVRVSGAGRDNYKASTCGSVGTLFSASGKQSPSAGNRVPEDVPAGPSKEIAKHGKTGTVCFLMNNYGNLPRSPRPASRLQSEGKRYVCRNSGNNMAKCLNQAAKPKRRSHLAANRKKRPNNSSNKKLCCRREAARCFVSVSS